MKKKRNEYKMWNRSKFREMICMYKRFEFEA